MEDDGLTNRRAERYAMQTSSKSKTDKIALPTPEQGQHLEKTYDGELKRAPLCWTKENETRGPKHEATAE